jgi:molecular chaperone GrpE
MSEKPTNGAGDDEIPVEVDTSEDDTRPVKVPDLGADIDAGTADAVEPAAELGAGLDRDDLLALLGQAETEKASLDKNVAELQERVESLEAANKETYERLLRSAADMENLRKRTRKDVDEAKLDARTKALKEMLPVIDNLDRAVAHADKSNQDAEGVLEGVRLVLRQFSQALERCDVQGIDAAGKPFDPNIHEAVSQVESAEHDAGTVVEVLQRGYTMGARLLRASLVVVAQAAAKPAPKPEPIPMPPAEDEGEAEESSAEAESGDSGADGAATPGDTEDAGSEPEQEA